MATKASSRTPDARSTTHPRMSGVIAVHPVLAWLRHERQRRERLHRRADRLVLIRGVPPEAGGWAQSFRLVQCSDLRLRAVRDTRGVRQQVANRDRAVRANHLGIRAVAHHHVGGGEFRDEAAHRIGETDPSLLYKRQDGHAREGFGMRRDAKDGVWRHQPTRVPCRSTPPRPRRPGGRLGARGPPPRRSGYRRRTPATIGRCGRCGRLRQRTRTALIRAGQTPLRPRTPIARVRTAPFSSHTTFVSAVAYRPRMLCSRTAARITFASSHDRQACPDEALVPPRY